MLPDMSILTKIGEKRQNWNNQIRQFLGFLGFSNTVEFTFLLFWCICGPENLQRVTRLKSFRSLKKSLISWFKIGTVYYVTGWRHHERFVYLKKPSSPKANNFRKQTGKLHWNCLFCIWSKNPDLWVLHYILGWC